MLYVQSGVTFTLTTGRVHLKLLRSMLSLNNTRRLEAEYTEIDTLKAGVRQTTMLPDKTEIVLGHTIKHTGSLPDVHTLHM